MSVLTPKRPENMVRRETFVDIGVFNITQPITPEEINKNVDHAIE